MSQQQVDPSSLDGIQKWTLYDKGNDNARHFEDRSTVEQKADDAESEPLCLDVEIYPPGEHPEISEPGPRLEDQSEDVEVVEHGDTPSEDVLEATGDADSYADQLPDEGPSVDEDPLVWMPDEFTDRIDGTVAINRKGFEVLAHHYDISCRTEVCDRLTTDDRVVFKATAEDADGTTYTAFGSAGEERDDVERGRPVVEMADTRSYKRALSRATGVGMVAVEELQDEVRD
jgi:hypothetical protein